MSSDANPKLPPQSIDIAAVRAKLADDKGQRFWQSLDELSETQRFRTALEHEFPAESAQGPVAIQGGSGSEGSEIGRRDVLKIAAASAALAGLSACTKLPTERIVPYVQPPEEIIPGLPLFYATSMPLAGVASGLLVESHMGRPTKVEGNKEHPGSLGGTDVFSQCSTLGLYDPDRSRTVMHDGRLSTWENFQAAISNAAGSLAMSGAGLSILTETITSPSLAAQMKSVMARFPQAKWHQYEPMGRDNVRAGAQMAFGRPVNTVYKFDQADVVVSLDADFINCGPGHVRYARDFSSRRVIDGTSQRLNRLYVVESMPTSTGATADHRRAVRASDVARFAQELAAAANVMGFAGNPGPSGVPANFTQAAAKDLAAHHGTSLVVAGEEQPPIVHALAHAMNASLGNVGKTVYYTEALEANPVNGLDSLSDLVSDMRSGKVQILMILGGNPVYDAPADLDFLGAMKQVPLRIHSGLYNDETAEWAQWHVPATHYLEMWGDLRAYDGTVSLIQPLIQPLYDNHSSYELLASLTKDSGTPAYQIVHSYWQTQRPEKDKAFIAFWEKSLHDGVMAGTALPAISVSPRTELGRENLPANNGALEIVFRPDPTIFDGRYANNGWLQELPRPITRLCWDNAAMISPATAEKASLATGDYVTLALNGRQASAPVLIVPGHADNSITAHLGGGRWRSGAVGNGPGWSPTLLRTTKQPWIGTDITVGKTGKTFGFALTQFQYPIDHDGKDESLEGDQAERRELIRVATLDQFTKDPSFAQPAEEVATKDLSLYPGFKYEGYSWGMAIDLNKCVGCNACVAACAAENNAPVVGKEQVMKGRAMHWIRIDTYFRGSLDAPSTYFEPMLCQQCENAPCEVVCPVGATVHSSEGLNDMVYNRCVGTRYCSNNCPYKVRRFNFLLYQDWTTPSLFGLRNPNVTVRSRGVMEKCTYCVQRINAAKIRSEVENRAVADGEIITACQGACPSNAIMFGNINDKSSGVSKWKAQTRNYSLLDDLNTRPRTTYLARVTNPNPDLKEA
jgi:MoCo/4Fe-4S cofactor protein with predicted Tat translocation signal